MNFMEEIDKLCLKYKIIPSIIKDSRLNKEIFNKHMFMQRTLSQNCMNLTNKEFINQKFQID